MLAFLCHRKLDGSFRQSPYYDPHCFVRRLDLGNTGHRDTIHTFRCARPMQQCLCCDEQGEEESDIMPVIKIMKTNLGTG